MTVFDQLLLFHNGTASRARWSSGIRNDAFGRTRIFDATGGELTQSAFGNPYMYTGRRYDPETGLQGESGM